MAQKNPVGWFDIPVLDLDRAEAWYSQFFGFSFDRKPEHNGYTMSWFPLDAESYGAPGCLMIGEGYVPSATGVMLYFTAPEGSVAAAVKKAESLNITVAIPPMAISNGFIAGVLDSEGNMIMIHSLVA